MDKTLHILVVDKDPKLRPEFEAAVAGTKLSVVPHFSPDIHLGVQAARSFQPDLVLVAMGRDVRALKNFTDELSTIAPDAVVAAIYRRDTLSPDRSEGSVIIDALRARVEDFLSRPLSTADLRQLLDRVTRKASTRGRASLGTLASFVSNKGGVGKSTLALNTACLLASRHPDRVLLIDASLQLGNCAAMLDLAPETSITDAVRQVDRLDETMLRELSTPHPCGLRFLAAPADPVEAADIQPEAISRVLNVARRAFDFVIVDTFPMVDNVVITILDVSDRVFVVFQGTVPTVLGIASFLKLLKRVGVPESRQLLILNSNHPGFVGALKPVDVADKLERTIDHVVPFEKRVLVAANTGVPEVLTAGGLRFLGFGGGFTQAIESVAAGVESLHLQQGRASPERSPEAPVEAASPEVKAAPPEPETAVPDLVMIAPPGAVDEMLPEDGTESAHGVTPDRVVDLSEGAAP